MDGKWPLLGPFSGLALLILSVCGVWTMFRTAYARPAPIPAAVHTRAA
jgi:hypothetical protein